MTGRGRNKSISGQEAEGDSVIPEVPQIPQDENGNLLLASGSGHDLQGSGNGYNDDAASYVGSQAGTPSKRKSRIHNPFKKH